MGKKIQLVKLNKTINTWYLLDKLMPLLEKTNSSIKNELLLCVDICAGVCTNASMNHSND